MLFIAVIFYCSALSLQCFDVCLSDNARERITAELTPAAERNPWFLLACRNDPRHGSTPLEDDKFLAGATDLIEQSQTLRLEKRCCYLHKTTVHDQCTGCQDLPLADPASGRMARTRKHRDALIGHHSRAAAARPRVSRILRQFIFRRESSRAEMLANSAA